MTTLGEFYNGFTRIDIDTRGGYARVAEVKTNGQEGIPEFCAFKVMRDEIEYAQGIKRFEEELKLLTIITRDENAPKTITKIYDGGFVPIDVAFALKEREVPSTELALIRTGLNVQAFQEQKNILNKNEPNKWLPYLAIELAPYNDSVFRQINNQPSENHEGLFRFATGEVIVMALQLLDTMQYLHEKHNRAYMDWKPEHIHWSGEKLQVKLIDWNITTPLEESPGKPQNIRDDLRLFCGAVLYIGLTFIDPEASKKPIEAHPTRELGSPIHELRRRYITDNPFFYQRKATLDNNIKEIIRKGLNPQEGFDSIRELRNTLVEYIREELGVTENELFLLSKPLSPYLQAMINVRIAQHHLYDAQENIIKAVKAKGSRDELTRLFDVIKHALKNFPTN